MKGSDTAPPYQNTGLAKSTRGKKERTILVGADEKALRVGLILQEDTADGEDLFGTGRVGKCAADDAAGLVDCQRQFVGVGGIGEGDGIVGGEREG